MKFQSVVIATLLASGLGPAVFAQEGLDDGQPAARQHRRSQATDFDFDFDLDIDVPDLAMPEMPDLRELARLGPALQKELQKNLGALGKDLQLELGPMGLLSRNDRRGSADQGDDQDEARPAPRPRPRPHSRADDGDDEDDDRDRDRGSSATREEREKARQQAREEARRAREEERHARDEARRAAREAREKVRERVRALRDERRRQGGSWFGEHGSWFGGREESSGAARRDSTAKLAVRGPITFLLHSQSANVDVVAGSPGQVQLTLTDAPATEIALALHGDRVEPEFNGRPRVRSGKLRVELPPGSKVDLQSMTGTINLSKVGGDARVRTMSSDVKVSGSAAADVQSLSGEVVVEGATGAVRVQTVSGNASVSMSSSAPQLAFASTSGSLDWAGTCGKGCRLSTETVSGDVKLSVGKGSSFAVSFTSHSGKVDRGGLSLDVKREPRRRTWGGGLYEAVLGSGEGVIEGDAFSGDLRFAQR